MRRRSLFAAALAAVASLSIAASAVAFSGMSNGSFENGTFSGSQYDVLTPGSTSLTGWTIESGSIDWIGSYWAASDGSRSIDLSGLGPGAISQALTTTAGNTYTVTFDLSGNPSCGPAEKTGTVGATGGSSEAFTYDVAVAGNNLGDMKWVQKTFAFVATATTSTVTFTSTTATFCGPAIDNVVVTETAAPPPEPEPAQPATADDCKDGGWIELVDSSGNHFKNQGDCVSYVATDHRNVAGETSQASAHAKASVNARTPRGDASTSSRRMHRNGADPAKPGHDRQVTKPPDRERGSSSGPSGTIAGAPGRSR
jgi:choice-of-anchor C domain-containing protein